MMWIVKYRNNVYEEIHYVNYPYIDHRGCATDPWELWYKDFVLEGSDGSFYDYLGAELVD